MALTNSFSDGFLTLLSELFAAALEPFFLALDEPGFVGLLLLLPFRLALVALEPERAVEPLDLEGAGVDFAAGFGAGLGAGFGAGRGAEADLVAISLLYGLVGQRVLEDGAVC